MKTLLKISSFLLMINALITCQEKDPDPSVTLPLTGCDGDLSGTDCQQFFVAEGETLSYPTGTQIKASKGIEINGDIIIDPSAGGDFTITATSGDIVIAGRIMVNDTTSGNSSGGRYKNGKNTSRLKDGKATDGFTLTLDARGPNSNIILKKGATLFSGRGQNAPDEILTSIQGYHEGAAGGNGGLIILNAPNGKVQLPDLGNAVTPIKDEVFVLGNGGKGANIKLDANLEVGELDIVEVRGGLGGNAGQLIIDADRIEGMPALEAIETHPDFIHGGEGGQGGYVVWENAGNDKKYNLKEITLHGGDGGDGAVYGGNGGFAYFLPTKNAMAEIGDPVPNVFCYGGHGGDVFSSPLPQSQVWGGDGGSYTANGVTGWDGGEDMEGNLIRDGADGGDALGQGGNGGDIMAGVKAYEAVGGSGGHSEEAQTEFPRILDSQLSYLSGTFGVSAGNGGDGYADCEGCRGGNGGNAGIGKAFGGKGGGVLGEVINSFGGKGGDTWAVSRGIPGDGGNGNPPGNAGTQQEGGYLYEFPGEGGSGATEGNEGNLLGKDLNKDLAFAYEGEACGEELECEEDTIPSTSSCTVGGTSTSYYYKETIPAVASQNLLTGEREYDDEIYIYQCDVSVLERDPVSSSVTKIQYSYSEKHTYKIGSEIEGNVRIYHDTTVRKEEIFVEVGTFTELPGTRGNYIGSLTRNPQCDGNGNLQWPGDGMFKKSWRFNGETRDHTEEWQVSGCVFFDKENNEIDRSHTQCCERSPGTTFPYQPCYKP